MPEETTQKPPELVFFLGAGASVDAGVPDTFSYVEEFKSYLGQEDRETVEKIESTLKSWQKKREEEEKVDIELLMEILDKLAKREDEVLLEFFDPKTFLLPGYPDKQPILELLKDYVKERSIVSPEKIQYLTHLRGFLAQNRPLNIFSVNYDICIEQFCNVYKLKYVDGFDVEWNPSVFENSNSDIRLFKLHGSITWYKSRSGQHLKSIVRSEKGEIELYTGEKADSLMLYPMRKWEYSEPLLENLLTLKASLQSDSCKYAIVVGYSFRDDYIREIFWDAARRNRELIVVFIDPKAYQIYSEKLEYYPRVEETPSSLQGRVVCLPFKFESILPALLPYYMNDLKNGMKEFDESNAKDVVGTPNIYWLGCIEKFADCLYVDKLEEVLVNKLGFLRESNKIYDVEKRILDINKLNIRVKDRMKQLVEILFKRCFAYYVNARQREGDEAFLDFVSCVYFVLHSRLSISINGTGFQLEPDKRFDGIYTTAKELDDLFSVFVNYRNPPWYDGLFTRINKLVDFVHDISDYLLDWSNQTIPFDKYIEWRKNNFSEETKKVLELVPRAKSNLNNPRHSDVQAIQSIVLNIERKVVKNIIEKHSPTPTTRRLVIAETLKELDGSKISEPKG